MEPVVTKFDGDTRNSWKNLQSKVSRLTDIFESIMTLQPPLEYWPEWIKLVKALLFQYESLVQEIGEYLRGYLIVPKHVLEGGVTENS